MQIKKYHASSMTEALKMIKQEFGPEAVILSVKEKEVEKGIFGFQKNAGVEVTAATDLAPEQDKQLKPINAYTGYSRYGRESNPNRYNPSERSHRSNGSNRSRHNNTKNTLKSNGQNHRLSNRGMKELFNYYHQMLNQDVDKEIALQIIRNARQETYSAGYISENGIISCIRKAINDSGVVACRVKLGKQSKKIIAIVGPPGVGKTTTIAKLAAAAKVREKRKSVALVTLDDNRIGAIEQLKVYAKILGTPVEAVSNGKDLKKCIDKLTDFQLIFIDTPGISYHKNQHLVNLKSILDKVNHIEYHLALNAATNEKSLRNILDGFKTFPLNRLIFTKLDECITHGSVLNQLYRTKIASSYFTTGQHIPDDIEAASIEKLVDLIFNKNNTNYLGGSPEQMAQRIIEFEQILDGTDEEQKYGRMAGNGTFLSEANGVVEKEHRSYVC